MADDDHVRLNLRLTIDEYDRVAAEARKRGMGIGRFVTLVALGEVQLPSTDSEILAHVRRLVRHRRPAAAVVRAVGRRRKPAKNAP